MIDHLPVHSTRGASGAHRWFNCPGAPAAEALCPDEDSIFALEGTAAHKLNELCWREDKPAQHFVGNTMHVGAKDGVIHDFPVTQEMATAVDDYQHAVKALIEPGDIVEHEVRVNLQAVTGREDTYGTADDLIFKPASGHLIVGDLKYGRGVVVEVRDNKQLRYYAVGGIIAAEERGWKVSKFTTIIGQPRAFHPGGPIRSETYEAVDVFDFIGELNEALKRTDDPNAPRVAGSWCHFCRAAAVCPENKNLALSTAQCDFAPGPPVIRDADGLPVVQQLTPDQVGWVMRRASIVENWIRAVRKYGASEADDGRCPTSFKRVRTRTNRVIPAARQAEALALLLDYGFAEEDLKDPGKLKSPAQIEKVIKADPTTRKGSSRHGIHADLGKMIVKPEGGWTLVPEESPKPSKEEIQTAGFTDTTKNETSTDRRSR